MRSALVQSLVAPYYPTTSHLCFASKPKENATPPSDARRIEMRRQMVVEV